MINTAFPLVSRETTWQRLYAFCIFAFFLFMSVNAIFTLYLPTYPLRVKIPSPLETWLISIAFGSFGFYIWWCTEYFCLYADENKVVQSIGFVNKEALYSDVVTYKWERLSNYTQKITAPVFYGEGGVVILRPVASLVVASASTLASRERFWVAVTQQIDASKTNQSTS